MSPPSLKRTVELPLLVLGPEGTIRLPAALRPLVASKSASQSASQSSAASTPAAVSMEQRSAGVAVGAGKMGVGGGEGEGEGENEVALEMAEAMARAMVSEWGGEHMATSTHEAALTKGVPEHDSNLRLTATAHRRPGPR